LDEGGAVGSVSFFRGLGKRGCLCVLLGAFAGLQAADSNADRLFVIEKDGGVQYWAGSQWKEAEAGTVLLHGNRVRTAPGASVKLAFDEGGESSVTLRDGALMDISVYMWKMRFTLETGRISVSILPEHLASFSIQTSNALVHSGTNFGVSYSTDSELTTSVSVFNGSALLLGLDADGQEQADARATLGEGKKAMVGAGGKISIVQELEPSDEEIYELKPLDKKPKHGVFFQVSLGHIVTGYETLDKKTYAYLHFQPSFQIGRLGIHFYIPIYYLPDAPFKVSRWYNHSEFDFFSGTFGNFVEDFLMKFRAIQWNDESHPIYAKFGVIENFTLGHGFIMNRFNNSVGFPHERRLGLEFRFHFEDWGVECGIADAFEMMIYGMRFYAQPFTGFFKDFTIGYMYAADHNVTTDSENYSKLDYASVFTTGIDVGQQMLSVGEFSMDVFGDFAMQGYKTIGTYLGETDTKLGFNGGNSLTVGTRWRTDYFKFSLAYRMIHDGFVSEYFDSFYYTHRDERAAAMIQGEDGHYNGFLLSTFYEFRGICRLEFAYEVLFGRSASKSKVENKIAFDAEMNKNLIPNLGANLHYERLNFSTKEFFTSLFDDHTLASAEISYRLTSGIRMVAVYRRFYDRLGRYKTSYYLETRFGR